MTLLHKGISWIGVHMNEFFVKTKTQRRNWISRAVLNILDLVRLLVVLLYLLISTSVSVTHQVITIGAHSVLMQSLFIYLLHFLYYMVAVNLSTCLGIVVAVQIILRTVYSLCRLEAFPA
jgi:hypothetical protein